MWGHDLRRVGRLDEAIAAFSRTDELEKAYYAQEKIPAGMDWHHVHNLDLLATSYEHKGQMRQAEKLLREAAAFRPSPNISRSTRNPWPSSCWDGNGGRKRSRPRSR